MTSNAETIVQHLGEEFQSLGASVTGPEMQAATAYAVEATLFRRLLALGAALLRLFFVVRAAERPAGVSAPDGTPLAYHDRRPTTYYSVVGKVAFTRHYFIAPGQAGGCPLDAAVSLPPRCYSDLLREWATYGSTDGSYRERGTALAHILGLPVSVQALETAVAEDARDVDRFYERPPRPVVAPAATILVVQADGKGVPQVQPPPPPPPVRLGTGQKRTKKKEAIVTALYTIAPYRRTPQEVAAALLHEADRAVAPARPAPVAKEVRATLAGKEVACARLAGRAAQRDTATIQQRVALTDGAEALQQHLLAHFPAYTLVLDIIHAAEYLWAAANALLGERHPGRTAWVRGHLGHLLAGQTDTVIAALQQAADEPTCTDPQREVVLRTVGYYHRTAPYMRYDDYLAQGWPSGTGVVEGACGHLVKDRMEQSGMRWTPAGAPALLDLRAVRLNGDWAVSWQFHRRQQHQRLYGATATLPAAPEEQLDQPVA